jgi:hypothetical protein
MKTYTVTNERYSNELVEATITDLKQLATENGWEVKFTETFRNGTNVIVDSNNEIVAEAKSE